MRVHLGQAKVHERSCYGEVDAAVAEWARTPHAEEGAETTRGGDTTAAGGQWRVPRQGVGRDNLKFGDSAERRRNFKLKFTISTLNAWFMCDRCATAHNTPLLRALFLRCITSA